MKVLFVIPLLSSYRSFLQDLGNELLKRGDEVFLLTNNTAGEKIEGINIINVEFPRGMNIVRHFRCLSKIRRVVEDVRPDVVHTHFSANIFTVALAKQVGWPPVIGTFHGLSFPVMQGFVKKSLIMAAEIYASRKMDWVCVLTHDDEELLARYVSHSRLYCYKSMGVGCDTLRFCKDNYTEKQAAALKEKLGIKAGDKVIVYVGRFVAFKGFHLVARTFNEMKVIGLKLLLLGKKDKIHPTGLSSEEEKFLFSDPNVINVGYVDNVEDYLAISDIMLFPSVKEGMPVCVMEALAMEVPVIVPNSRGCNSLVFTGRNGVVLDDLEIGTIVRSIKQLVGDLNNPQMKDYLRRNRDIYDRKYFINEQKTMYDEITNRVNRTK